MRGEPRIDRDGRPDSLDHIPPSLQQAWLSQLRRFFDLFNENYLRGQLRRPVLRLGFGAVRLGQWDGSVRCITISASHIMNHPWESVLVTLRHEMAHQFVEEVLGVHGAPPHGEPFAKACHLLRVDPSGSSPPQSLGHLENSRAARDRILARVKDLLALAGSPNEHEAANAMRMANKYLLKYNLDLAQARSVEEWAVQEYATRHLGKCSPRVQEYEYVLAHILQDHFFVSVIWIFSYDAAANKTGRILQISGTPDNLEMAEYVYHYVVNLSERLWTAHRKLSRRARGSRLQYMAGLLRGLQHKLDQQRGRLKEEQGLLWLGDPHLRRYYRYINPYVRNASTSGVRRGERFAAGLQDGREITIHRGVGGGATRRGRLLDN